MAHHQEGKDWYGDTDFINKVQYVYPGAYLKHMGFGEFELETPDGTLQFDRMRGKDFPGQSGRSHKLYDDARGKVVEKAIKLMERSRKSERLASDKGMTLRSKHASPDRDVSAFGKALSQGFIRALKGKHLVKVTDWDWPADDVLVIEWVVNDWISLSAEISKEGSRVNAHLSSDDFTDPRRAVKALLREFDKRWRSVGEGARDFLDTTLRRQGKTMTDKTLRSRLIRLAHRRPDLRPQILPMLAKQASAVDGGPAYGALTFASAELLDLGMDKEALLVSKIKQTLLRQDPGVRSEGMRVSKEMHKRYHVDAPTMMTLPGPNDPAWKTASPVALDVLGLDARAARSGMGAMLYFIDAAKNHSKFYEMVIVPEGGGFKFLRRRGALTDKGAPGRIDGANKDQYFDDLGQAKRALAKYYKAKTRKGYVDAYDSSQHKSPDGRTLPMGRYPVGLTRDVGFGWGTQEAAFCTPAHRKIQALLLDAQKSLDKMQFQDASETLNQAATLADRSLGRRSEMATKIRDNVAHMQGRAQKLLSGEIDRSAIRNWRTALSRLVSYIDKQLSVCQ
jgi:predicted DNA-binding WGR domain protein